MTLLTPSPHELLALLVTHREHLQERLRVLALHVHCRQLGPGMLRVAAATARERSAAATRMRRGGPAQRGSCENCFRGNSAALGRAGGKCAERNTRAGAAGAPHSLALRSALARAETNRGQSSRAPTLARCGVRGSTVSGTPTIGVGWGQEQGELTSTGLARIRVIQFRSAVKVEPGAKMIQHDPAACYENNDRIWARPTPNSPRRKREKNTRRAEA